MKKYIVYSAMMIIPNGLFALAGWCFLHAHYVSSMFSFTLGLNLWHVAENHFQEMKEEGELK